MKKTLIFIFTILITVSFVINTLSFFEYIKIEKEVYTILNIILFTSIFFMILLKTNSKNV
jgi:hypothetical protein